MIKLSNFRISVIIGLLLSDGSFATTNRSINKSLRFKQCLGKSEYV